MTGGEFKRKKIDSLTLGEKMKKIRSERRISLNEISKNTGIQLKYLEYLEAGDYQKLPADVYVKGFLKSYAEYVGANEENFLRLYTKEKDIQKNIKKVESVEKIIKPLSITKWVITPKLLFGGFAVLFLFLGIFYLYCEIDDFISNPKIVIISPEDGAMIEGRTVEIRGFAEKSSQLEINNQPVMIGENGQFREEISLQEGINLINVKSRNKFDKESEISISVNAHFKNNLPENFQLGEEAGASPEQKVEIEIVAKNIPVWISVEADGNLIFSGTIAPDVIQKFEASQKISVTSANGKNTYVKMPGEKLRALSNKEEVVKNIIFESGIENRNKIIN